MGYRDTVEFGCGAKLTVFLNYPSFLIFIHSYTNFRSMEFKIYLEMY